MTRLRVFFATALLAPSLAAQTPAELTYDAPEGCPPLAEFRAAVAARGASFDVHGDARRLDVAIRKEAQAYVGELRVQTARGPSAVRRVEDPECSEVVEGLAVVAAIALGAERDEPAQTAAAPEVVEAPASEPAVTVAPTPPEAPRRLRGNSFFAPDSVEVPAGKLRFERITSATLSGGAELGLVPGLVTPRFDFDLTATNLVTSPSAQSFLSGPILRARWGWLGPAVHERDGFETTVSGFSAGVGVCSALTYDSHGFTALACSEFGLSLLQLDTESADGAFTKNKQVGLGYADVGLSGQYNFGDLFHVDVRAGARFHVGDLSAQRPDGSDLFEAGMFSGYATAGLGLHFW